MQIPKSHRKSADECHLEAASLRADPLAPGDGSPSRRVGVLPCAELVLAAPSKALRAGSGIYFSGEAVIVGKPGCLWSDGAGYCTKPDPHRIVPVTSLASCVQGKSDRRTCCHSSSVGDNHGSLLSPKLDDARVHHPERRLSSYVALIIRRFVRHRERSEGFFFAQTIIPEALRSSRVTV
jgi:hypothetical protein